MPSSLLKKSFTLSFLLVFLPILDMLNVGKGLYDMEIIHSKIENKTYLLYDLERKLKPLGYVIGGNWDYDHGYFDYKIDEEDGYHFLRVPFKAEDGQLDSKGVTVRLENPFVLTHVYQGGISSEADSGVFTGTVSQFQEPIEKDGNVPDKILEIGRALVEELEYILLS